MKKSFLGPNVKTLGTPLLYLIASVILLVVVLRVGLAKINEQGKTLSQSKASQQILEQKVSLLREFETDVSSFVDASANAIPEKNPVLTMVSQLRNLALVQGLVVTSFKIGSETAQSGISSVELTVGADGTPANILTFIQSLSQVAPLSMIDKAKINTAAGIASANLSVKVYFAPFPQKLPALTEPIAQLSADERGLLETLTSLSSPIFSILTPQAPSVRGNPFE